MHRGELENRILMALHYGWGLAIDANPLFQMDILSNVKRQLSRDPTHEEIARTTGQVFTTLSGRSKDRLDPKYEARVRYVLDIVYPAMDQLDEASLRDTSRASIPDPTLN